MSDGGACVIGLGNPLLGDDGLGLAALERLRGGRELGGVTLVDGGTWGMTLLPAIEAADPLVLLDAIDVGAEPGTVVVLERPDLPRFLSLKLSPHQIDLREVLALAELRGTLPARTVALGLQPASFEPGSPLSPALADRVELLVALARDRLRDWGCLVADREVA